ncbi:unnamed protein product [Rotaria magnacalcarata]|uniref:Ammonium transporter AmtB-like domain-containing protein n=2 Tax=Rotaria magnacalcarata TaxID=392030 RepID=A0A814YEE4_9BILA|nr:unnamed protein product [Rotaria magnacalcarata]CAF1623905.1 unnamed protein product [Rotaria magnacalcarata]CAF2147497.1 unnamed protein product [Rotaria magnacalcarata]CAF3809551.1 unnamed protein product [Rotaria magnacalcarata]CAF3927364.1 unnamed protein product [Rotaria magnacalcarata]
MATSHPEETELVTKSVKLVPIAHIKSAKKPILFPALLLALQAVFIVLLGVNAEYGHEPVTTTHTAHLTSTLRSTITYSNGTVVQIHHEEPAAHRGITDFYAMFQDIHVMIFIGFGFLMTFLKRYGFSAVGFNFLVAAFVLEWALIVRGYMFDYDVKTNSFPIDVERIIVADFVAASVLISFGAVLGKTNPTQLIIMAFIEVLLQSANEFLGLRRFCAFDIGESMFVHVFGAYFGLAVAYMLYDQELTSTEASEREKSVYHSDLFSMIGTIFLFCFWPSFNAGVAASGDPRLRAIVNTYISIASSVLLTYICSCLFNKDRKFDMVHIQNATLAGGVAVGTVADKIIRPFGAMIIGSVAGGLSTIGFHFIKSKLQKFRAHDTCGVNNLHGMPGLLAGIFGIVLAFFPTISLHTDNLLDTCWHGENRSHLAQVCYQAATLLVTVGIAIVGGIITGAILRLSILNDERPSSYHNDHVHWETPDDFYQDAHALLFPSHVEEHI